MSEPTKPSTAPAASAAAEGWSNDFFNRVEMRRRFAFLDDTWAQWREDLEGHIGIGLLALPIFLCFLLLSMLLGLQPVIGSASWVQWALHLSLDFLLVLLYLPIGPVLVGVARYFLVHQRLRTRAQEHAPTAIQTFTQPTTVDTARWAERPAFGLVVSGFRPLWPGLAAMVMIFLISVVPASLLLALGAWLGINIHVLVAAPLYLCAALVCMGLTAVHLYAFHFIAEAGLPAGEALKASRQAVKADPLLAVGTLLIMVMIGGLGFLMCGVGLLIAVPAAWLILTRAFLTLPDRPSDLALNEFDPVPPAPPTPPSPSTPAAPVTPTSVVTPPLAAVDSLTPDTLAGPAPTDAAADKPADKLGDKPGNDAGAGA